MRQIVQNMKKGSIEIVDVPVPLVTRNTILVKNTFSLLSIGTERHMIDFAKKTVLGKAIERPDLVRQVFSKARSDGVVEAYNLARQRLDSDIALGNSSTGIVLQVGEDVEGIKEGDRVACSGSGYASHAEVISVPHILTVKVPDGVSDEAAAFVTLGSIAIHAVRVSGAKFGERTVVLGLGLLGQLAVQILSGNGFKVFGLDIDPDRVDLALSHGAHGGATIGRDDVAAAVNGFTEGRGADTVIIFASARSNDPIELAAKIARDRSIIVVPGLVGLDIPRKIFYEKELRLVVSRAWGPGVYDPRYERGEDYPFSYVRWTARKNMSLFLDMVAEGKVSVEHLITHRLTLDYAVYAYEQILRREKQAIGILIDYRDAKSDLNQRRILLGGMSGLLSRQPTTTEKKRVSIGLIGAGLFARSKMLPVLKSIPAADLAGVCTRRGFAGNHVGRKFGFRFVTTDVKEIFKDPDIDLVMILTPHGSHARFVCEAWRADKCVFVEKPLCVNESQLLELIGTYREMQDYRSKPPFIMVGFNRRFAPMTQEAIRIFSRLPRPLVVNIRVNATTPPGTHWIYDANEGGGNIIGEVCHFIDLIQAITGSFPSRVYGRTIDHCPSHVIAEDNVAITLEMSEGSVGTILYTTMGDKSFGKERVEIIGGGAICTIENFKRMVFSCGGKRRRIGGLFSRADRGHKSEMDLLISSILGGKPPPVPFESYVATTRATFAAIESIRTGRPVAIKTEF